MKKLTALAGAVALALAAVPAQAYTVLPSLFTMRYCQLREIGASYDDAMTEAVRYAMIDADQWVWVTTNGRRKRSDTVEAVNGILRSCPKYLGK